MASAPTLSLGDKQNRMEERDRFGARRLRRRIVAFPSGGKTIAYLWQTMTSINPAWLQRHDRKAAT